MISDLFDYIDHMSDLQFVLVLAILAIVTTAWSWYSTKGGRK